MNHKNVNREGLTYGEFRAAAFAFCTDPNERLDWERAVRRAWQAGEDPTDYANEISKALAKKRETALARLDADGTAQPLTRIAVHLHNQQAYHGAPHASRDGVWEHTPQGKALCENGNERIRLR